MRKLATVLMAAGALTILAGAAHAQDKRKVKIGTEGAYPPFNSIATDGQLVGFDIDIAKALCAAANFECEFVVQDWDGIIPGLIAKKYDAIIASMSITDQRKEVVNFSDKYYATPAKFVAAKGAGFDISPEGLAGMAVGVQRATVSENFVRGEFPEVDVRAYATQDEANADLVSGRLDLVLADAVVLLEGFLNTDAGKDFEFVGLTILIRSTSARALASRSARARTTCVLRSTKGSTRSAPTAPIRRSMRSTSPSTSTGRPRNVPPVR
jgi:lysine-arginine-ornithine-binding protein